VGRGTTEDLRELDGVLQFSHPAVHSPTNAPPRFSRPFTGKYWGVGNEIGVAVDKWLVGGDEYAALYRRFTTYLRGFGSPLFLLACGP